MPTNKKKTKAATASDAAPDPRESLKPTPANLAATLQELKLVLADVPAPPPIEKPPAKAKARPKASAAEASDAAAPAPSAEASSAEAPTAEARSTEDRSADAKAAAAGSAEDAEAGAAAAGADAASAGAKKAAEGGDAGNAEGEAAALPQLDLVDALLHIYFANGLPCGYGQEALRRIEESFVDRNEFRVTEAFEVEDLLSDLEIPELFDRCLAVRESIAQIYNDQNGVSLAFLREAGISDRNTFFQRVPAVQPHVVTFLQSLLTIEEICFSDKSTLRAQQRLGLDPKNAGVSKFVDELRALVKPYGHLPLAVGKHGNSGKPNLKHTLSPACILVRLAPPGKRR